MGQDMEAAQPQTLHQALHEIGLAVNTVVAIVGLIRVAKAEHVHGDQAVAADEIRPDTAPVPTRRGETVDKQEGVGLPAVVIPIENPVPQNLHVLALFQPVFDGWSTFLP